MTYNEIRKSFLEYFKSKGHTIVPSVSLIPNDPTLLFTVAGMVPWKGMLQGLESLKYGPRVADCQKCLRAGGKHNDLDEVGFDATHHTFFEMLGNWSFGDYFKTGAIEMSWELLTCVLKLPPEKLRVTTHTSDDEATEIWKKVANKDAIRLGDKDNWWSAGDTGPCGPCTEIFYDMGEDILDDDKRWIEIWNNVFMQYDRDANGNLKPLPKQNVDTGAGLERLASVLQGKTDNFDTDLFVNLIAAIEKVVGVKKTAENTPSFKIIADHLRAVGFAIADGIIPSNTDRGYVIRRILRRAMRHGQILGHRGELLSKLYPTLAAEMGDAYPELVSEQARVIETIKMEENSFADMLQNGMKLLDAEVAKIKDNILSGEVAFKLFDTFGFPLDLTQMILRDKNISVDADGFAKCMQQQKERSRADTKGTKTLWESRTDLPATDDTAKYYSGLDTGSPLAGGCAQRGVSSKVLAILRLSDGEFVESANSGDEIEVVLDKTDFYGTQGGQVGDVGNLTILNTDPFIDGSKDPRLINILTVSETNRVGRLVIHKGVLSNDLKVKDEALTLVNSSTREQTARAHTAAHLLQAALQKTLGESVQQKGSKVSPDSVRFDFSFGRAMTADKIAETEKLINDWIKDEITVERLTDVKIDDARAMGAMALFGEKYGDSVNIIRVGDISIELCGGTHIDNTEQIIGAKIIKEKSISSGIRRITMTVGQAV